MDAIRPLDLFRAVNNAAEMGPSDRLRGARAAGRAAIADLEARATTGDQRGRDRLAHTVAQLRLGQERGARP
jgi:hypothetical protein